MSDENEEFKEDGKKEAKSPGIYAVERKGKKNKFNRRDFLLTAGVGASAVGLIGAGINAARSSDPISRPSTRNCTPTTATLNRSESIATSARVRRSASAKRFAYWGRNASSRRRGRVSVEAENLEFGEVHPSRKWKGERGPRQRSDEAPPGDGQSNRSASRGRTRSRRRRRPR